MLLLQILWYGLFIAVCAWLIVDIIIPLLIGKPVLTMFRKTKKNDLKQQLIEQNQTFDELRIQEEVNQRQRAIDEAKRKLEDVVKTEKGESVNG